jgi:predicted lipid-binding transport protein (Tim44 family)
MNKALIAIFAAVVALGLAAGDAEAARMGGGRSVGMQRQSVAPRPAAPAQQATPAAPAPTPAGAPTPAPKRSWMGPLAGLAAGLGLGALMSHFGFGPGMANFLMIVLLAMAAVFVFKLLFRRQAPPPERGINPATYPAEPIEYANAQPAPAPAVSAPAAALLPNIPAGFDSEGFLRVAKLNFVRLQAANDEKNVEDIREFTSPELFAEIRLQMDERGNAPQQTDVVTLNAELLEVANEGNRHVASVLFSGMIREQQGAAAAPFGEIWNLVKPVDGSRGWTVAGIQQVH